MSENLWYPLWLQCECSASRGTYCVIFGLKCYPKCSNSLSQRLSNIYNIKLQNDYQLTIKLAINIQLSDTDQSKPPWLTYTCMTTILIDFTHNIYSTPCSWLPGGANYNKKTQNGLNVHMFNQIKKDEQKFLFIIVSTNLLSNYCCSPLWSMGRSIWCQIRILIIITFRWRDTTVSACGILVIAEHLKHHLYETGFLHLV